MVIISQNHFFQIPCDFLMPTIVDIDDDELAQLLGNGGLKSATLAKRRRYYDEVCFTLYNVVLAIRS